MRGERSRGSGGGPILYALSLLYMINEGMLLQVIISGLECAAAFTFAVLYITRVRWHNKTEAIPDAQMYLQSALYTSPTCDLG